MSKIIEEPISVFIMAKPRIRKTLGFTLLAALCFLTSWTLVAFAQQNRGQPKEILQVLKEISDRIKEDKYGEAAKFIKEIEAATLAKQNSGKIQYLALNGFVENEAIPGIPAWRANVIRNTADCLTIPGTSDYSRTDEESNFQDVAMSFAASYNMHLRFFGTEVEKKRGEAPLEEIRVALELTSDDWAKIPLHAQLKIRNLLEQLIEVTEMKAATKTN